jgi:hypothetical protein
MTTDARNITSKIMTEIDDMLKPSTAAPHSSLITPELIEKALDGFLASADPVKFRKPYKIAKFKIENHDDCQQMRGAIRGTLKAAIPTIIEECAKLSDEYDDLGKPFAGDAIRALGGTP